MKCAWLALALLFWFSRAEALTACVDQTIPPGYDCVEWQPPTENVDGTPLTDGAGYRVYYGPSTRQYTSMVEVPDWNTTHQLLLLPPGVSYIAATAYDVDANESAYSNEVTRTVQQQFRPPDAPSQFTATLTASQPPPPPPPPPPPDGGGSVAISVVQSKASVGNASASPSVSFTSGGSDQLTAGNTLLVFTMSNETTTDRTHDSVSDSVDGAFTKIAERSAGPATGRIAAWIRHGGITTNADRTITANFSTADANTGLIAIEISGVYAPVPYEATATTNGEQDFTITTRSDNAAVFAFRMTDTNQAYTPTGYTDITMSSNWWYQFVHYNLDVGAAGLETGTNASWDPDAIRVVVALTDANKVVDPTARSELEATPTINTANAIGAKVLRAFPFTEGSGTKTRDAAPPPGNILFVVGNSGAPNADDVTFRDWLVTLGYTVTYADDSDAEGTADYDVVIISESVSASNVGVKYLDASAPVLVFEGALGDDHEFCSGAPDTDNATTGVIVGSHWIVTDSGLSGTITFSNTLGSVAATLDSPASGVTAILDSATTGQERLGVIDTGGTRADTSTAPNRRAFFGIDDTQQGDLTADGEALIASTIRWLVGKDGDTSGNRVATLDADVTWGNTQADNFNRADADNPITGNWEQLNSASSRVRILSNAVTASHGSPGVMRLASGTFSTSQFAQLKITDAAATSNSSLIGVIVNASGDTDGARDYYALYVDENTFGGSSGDSRDTYLVRVQNGSETTLSGWPVSVAWANNDVIKLENDNGTLKAYKNGSQIGSNTADSNLTGGRPGVTVAGSAEFAGDDFYGGDLAELTASTGGVHIPRTDGVEVNVDADRGESFEFMDGTDAALSAFVLFKYEGTGESADEYTLLSNSSAFGTGNVDVSFSDTTVEDAAEHSIGIAWDATDARSYLDGTKKTTDSTVTGPLERLLIRYDDAGGAWDIYADNTATGHINLMIGGTGEVTGDRWEGPIELVLLFDSKLTDAEMASLAANPWQVFNKAAAVGPTITNVPDPMTVGDTGKVITGTGFGT